MERTLLWSVVVMGCLGWICACLVARSRPASGDSGPLALTRGHTVAVLIIPLLVFLGTLPSHPPFAPGQGLGRGFLIGAIGAWLAGIGLRLTYGNSALGSDGERAATARPSGPMFLAPVAVAIPLLRMRAELPDALLGVAIGWFVISFILIGSWFGHGRPGRLASLAQAGGVGFVVTLAAFAALGAIRGAVRFTSAPLPMAWSAPGLAFAICVPLLILLGSLLATPLAHAAARLPGAGLLIRMSEPFRRRDEGGANLAVVARLILAGILLLLAARFFTMRLEGHPPLIALTAAGLITGLICWWLSTESNAERHSASTMATWQSRGLGALVMLAGIMAAYQWFAGIGVAWMLVCAWLVVGCVTGILPDLSQTQDTIAAERAQRLTALLLFGVVIALYRLFEARYRHSLQGVEISDHYALFGLLIGLLVPPMLTGFLVAHSDRSSVGMPVGIGRIVAAGALTLFVPSVILIVFGAKCALALFFGLAAAAALAAPMIGTSGDTEEAGPTTLILPGLFALAIALALTQWTDHVLPLALLARAAKVRALGLIVGALVAVILAADYGDRLQSWIRSRRDPDVLTRVKGVAK